MDTQILAPLTAFETQITSLVTSLTQTNTYATAPQIAQNLLNTDDELTASLNLLYRHQQNYARILNLRAEVASLQDQLQSTIKQCVALREEVGQIHHSILSADLEDDSEDEHDKVAEVDYQTLLTFAARIGKHNAVAAREAEAESRRYKNSVRSDAVAINGGQNTSTADGLQNATDETNAEIERINNTIAITRAQMGMAFPDASGLRVGELGRLQRFREQQMQSMHGEGDAVDQALDAEIERLVRETEDVADYSLEKQDDHDSSIGLSPEATRQPTAGGASASQQQPEQPTVRPSQSKPNQQAQPKRKLDLDFPSSDEDDD